jgi:hypothetical protein
MASALKGTTAAMVKMNKQMNLPAMQKIMMEFQSEEMKAEMTMEVFKKIDIPFVFYSEFFLNYTPSIMYTYL